MSLEWIIKILQNNWPMLLRGAGMTLLISIIGTLVGTLIGLIVGVIRTIPIPEKGTKRVDRVLAGLFIVSVNTGAYMSEIVRGGIVSIDKGQFEAAQAIGMNHFQTMINVVLPQVVRNILPATGNEFVINIKDTSVLNVISVSELYFQTKTISGNNFRYFESFFISCIIYFIMTFTVTRILRAIEKKLDGPENYIIAGNQMQVETPEDIAKKVNGNVVA